MLPPWLLFPLVAGAVTTTGLLYPYVSGEEAPDISEIMRCVAVSVGIFQASTVSLVCVCVLLCIPCVCVCVCVCVYIYTLCVCVCIVLVTIALLLIVYLP